MGTKREMSLSVVIDNETGERKVAISADGSDTAFFFTLEELRGLGLAINGAIAYIEEHGTHITESVPSGAVRH